jgi:hypothetical protein
VIGSGGSEGVWGDTFVDCLLRHSWMYSMNFFRVFNIHCSSLLLLGVSKIMMIMGFVDRRTQVRFSLPFLLSRV